MKKNDSESLVMFIWYGISIQDFIFSRIFLDSIIPYTRFVLKMLVLEIRLFFIRIVVNKNPVLFFGLMKSTTFGQYSMNTNLGWRSVSIR